MTRKKPLNIDQTIIKKNKYFLMTLHRPNNVDNINKLKNLILSIDSSTEDTPIIFPIHQLQ